MPPIRSSTTRQIRSPSPPKPPKRIARLPPIRLPPPRDRESLSLDERTSKSGLALPPFIRWDQFIAGFRWKEGQHITTVGPTGSGKTVLNRELLKRAPLKERKGQFVVVFGIKSRDDELYAPFRKMGYERAYRFDAFPPEEVSSQHVIFTPTSDKRGVDGLMERGRKFRDALHDVEAAGGWTLYADDLYVMAATPPEGMGLRGDFGLIWSLARSEGVELVASTTEPVNVPVAAYSSAAHLFLFKNLDDYRAKRMAEFTGVNREVARETILRLPDHEFLYVNKSSGEMVRSRVIAPARPG